VRIALLLLLAACGASYEEASHQADVSNQHARADSDARIASLGAAFQPAGTSVTEPSPPAPAGRATPDVVLVAGPHTHGLGDDEFLYAPVGGGTLRFVSVACAVGGSCGCSIPVGYTYLHDRAGRVVIVRRQPEVTYREVHVHGACGYGCGVPPPGLHDGPVPAVDLGVASLDRVEVREDRYPLEIVDKRCDKMIPAP
jgi:hypothetical protein